MKIDDLKNEKNNEYIGKYIETNAGTIDQGMSKNEQASEGIQNSNSVIGVVSTQEKSKTLQKDLPTKFGMWSKVKSFLFNEIGFSRSEVWEVSPKEEKVLTEVHDFLFQEISFSGLFSLGKGKNKNKNEEL